MNERVEIVEDHAVPVLPGRDFVRHVGSILWNRKKLIFGICCACFLAGFGALFLIEPRYTASAVIQFDFSDRGDYSRIIDLGEQDGTVAAPAIAIDASREVESFARLIMTDAIARRIVKRLGLDTAHAQQSFLSKWLDSRLPVRPSSTDKATLELLEGLNVSSDLRSYLLTITYAATNPEQAAKFANAFLSEALRVQSTTRLNNQFATAQRQMKQLLHTFGDKHPTIAKAEANLAAAQQRLESQQQIEALNDGQFPTGGNVIPAEVNTVPTYPKPRMVMMASLALGLVAGIASALLLEFAPALKRRRPEIMSA